MQTLIIRKLEWLYYYQTDLRTRNITRGKKGCFITVQHSFHQKGTLNLCLWDFVGGPVVRICLPMQGMWVQSWVGELVEQLSPHVTITSLCTTATEPLHYNRKSPSTPQLEEAHTLQPKNKAVVLADPVHAKNKSTLNAHYGRTSRFLI